jgi:hypothetical protein
VAVVKNAADVKANLKARRDAVKAKLDAKKKKLKEKMK